MNPRETPFTSIRKRTRPSRYHLPPSCFFLLLPCLRIFILRRIPAIKRAPKSARSVRNWKDPPFCRASTRCRIYRPEGIRIAPRVLRVSTRSVRQLVRRTFVVLRKKKFLPKFRFETMFLVRIKNLVEVTFDLLHTEVYRNVINLIIET